MARVTPESIEVRVMDGADALELLAAATDALASLRWAAFLASVQQLPAAAKCRARADRLEAALAAFAKKEGDDK